MELLFTPAVGHLTHVQDNAPSPGGMHPWPGVPVRCRSYGDNCICSQRIEGGYYRILCFHITLTTAVQLVPQVRQRALAFAFIHRGNAKGWLRGVQGLLHFRERCCYIPLLLPDTGLNSLVELDAGNYEATVILLEKDREEMILDMFSELREERQRLHAHSGKGLPYPPLPITPEIRMLLAPLTRFRALPSHLPWIADQCVPGLITALHKAHLHQEHMPDDFRRIRNYLSTYIDTSLTVKKVAFALRMSERRLCTVIRQQQGMTFKACLTGLRMEQARILLTDPDRQLHDIALDLGYSSKAHFSHAFHKYTGISPSAYRAAPDEEKPAF